MFGTMLICVGVLLVASGGIGVGLHRSMAALAARVLRRRPVPIAEALENGPLCIDGTVAANEEGALIAPCSGEAVVWFRLRMRDRVLRAGKDAASALLTVIDEECGVVFHVEDGSGASAQVDPNGARVMTKAVGFGELPLEAHDRVRLFLEGRERDFWIADAYEEECLRPGDRVLVAGLARREPDAPLPNLYRDAPSSKLVLDAASGHELVVATPDAARAAHGGGYRQGWIAVLVGLAMMTAGLVARWGGAE
jgi:hypothetical protein